MYVKELEAMLQSSYAMARRNLEISKVHNKRRYDQYMHVPKFEIGEQVFVKDESVRRERSKKLEASYFGWYEIVGTEGPNLLLRTKRSKILKIHANRTKPFFFSITHVGDIFVAPTMCSNNRGPGYRLPN
jgi:hypothetical protein